MTVIDQPASRADDAGSWTDDWTEAVKGTEPVVLRINGGAGGNDLSSSSMYPELDQVGRT